MADPNPTIPLPNPDALHDENNKPTTAFYRYLSSVEREARSTSKSIDTINTSIATNAANIATLQTNVNTLTTLSAQKLTYGTAKTFSTSTASWDFTNIPSWVKRITIIQNNLVSSQNVQIQLGTATGIDQNTNYIGNGFYLAQNAGFSNYNSNSSFVTSISGTSNGAAILYNPTGNVWTLSGTAMVISTSNSQNIYAGSKTLTGPLTTIRIFTTNGNFSSGTINILYE